MNFKDQMQRDLDAIMNVKEFAELIHIEGLPEPVPAVCEWQAEPEGQHLYAPTDSWGVNAVHATVMLAESALPEMSPGCELTINNRCWTVRSASAAGGLLTLKLYRNVA